MSDALFQTVLSEYNQRAAREAQTLQQMPPQEMFAARDTFLLHVGEEVGNFLHVVGIARGAKRILEIGTSYGYSTLFLAHAAQATAGRVTTLDLVESKQVYARKQLEKAGLAGRVEWMLGDALEAI